MSLEIKYCKRDSLEQAFRPREDFTKKNLKTNIRMRRYLTKINLLKVKTNIYEERFYIKGFNKAGINGRIYFNKYNISHSQKRII